MASGSRWLKRALAELPPVGLLPPEYVGGTEIPVLMYAPLVLGGVTAAWLILYRHQLALAAAVFLGVVFAGSIYVGRRNLALARQVCDRLMSEKPTTAQRALDSVFPILPRIVGLPMADLLLEGLSGVETWAGQPERSARVSYVALTRLPDPPEPKRVVSLCRGLVEALALAGETERAQTWPELEREVRPR